MSLNARKIAGFVLSAVVALAASSWGQEPAPMIQVEQDGYLQWLHSLEQEVAARQDKKIVENHALYPFNNEEVAICDSTPYRHLTIAKALGVLETQFQDPRHARNLSGLVALANARNYVNLTEYDSSLVWFNVAAQRDTAGDFTSELKVESLAAAIAANDSLRLAGQIRELTSAGVRDRDPLETVLALRWCLVSGDPAQLDQLCDDFWAARDVLNNSQCYWLARVLHKLGRSESLYTELKVLIRNGGLSLGLTEDERAWTLTTLADVSYLLGLESQARELYSTLTESPLESLNLWATYQLAGMDMADGEFLAASTGYSTVCRAQAQGSWHDQACAMEKAAQELERIRREGEPYGTSRFYNP